MILRFMGDLPEPKTVAATPEVKEHGSLAKRLKGSIGRKFGSSNRLSELAEVRPTIVASTSFSAETLHFCNDGKCTSSLCGQFVRSLLPYLSPSEWKW